MNLADSPRLEGESLEHARVLANVHGELPPIIVRRSTLQVIDGRHRIRAALMNGRSRIRGRLVDCDDRTAFALAVKENITHGLPLSLKDRRAAAIRIITSHPHWSDRIVAEQTGLSDKTVSTLRARALSGTPSGPEARVGKDGRLRPLNSAAQRRKAASLLSERPDIGLREISRLTGLSPATVRDVRIRLDAGKDPVPERYNGGEPKGDVTQIPKGRKVDPVVQQELLTKIQCDPSLRFSDAGRKVIRWLYRHSVQPEPCEHLATDIPDHWAMPIADLARECAAAWIVLAERLERRHNSGIV
ncbi:ParB N-terminal domain-containing protein [Actinomadura luteofluorescens]|uniref:ParB N-terminal domain-containing protein n=1 Tax=Actinomadura luteofluorescens TaxID=46163 RepID=UPI00348CDC75